MRAIIAYGLLLTIFSTQLKILFIYASFKINQDYIAKELCINKDKKESTCKGRCHLSKQIAEAEEDDEETPLSQKKEKKKETRPLVYLKDTITAQHHHLFKKNNKAYLSTSSRLLAGVKKEVFQPPQV